MDDRARAHLHRLLDQHNDAFAAFRAASLAFDDAMDGLRTTLNAVQAANHAQGEAIAHLHAANQAALALLNTDPQR